MIRVIVITPGETYETCGVEVAEIDGSLESFQGLVGGYIESVPVNIAGCGAYVNEEGRLQRLAANVLASHICPLAGPAEPVVGPMVLFGEGDPERTTPVGAVDDLQMIAEGPHPVTA